MDPYGGGRNSGNGGEASGGRGPALFPPRGYAMSGKIMLSSIVSLFSIVLFVLVIHLYARWYLLRRANSRRSRQRLVFAAESNYNNSNHLACDTGRRCLDTGILDLIPIHIAVGKESEMTECAVCLSAFEEGEKLRTLPQCRHSFHVECIDMWFHSHSTCPLCRCFVSAPPPPPISEPPAPARSSSCATAEIRIEAMRISEEGSSSSVFKSPVGRILTLKRLLSRDLRFNRSGETDLERGEGAVRTPPPPPSPSTT